MKAVDKRRARHVRRIAGAAGVLALAGALGAAATAPGTARAQSSPHAGARPSPIRHIVVLYLENHSFDSLFGFWCDDNPGRCPDGGMPASVRLSNGAVVKPFDDPDVPPIIKHTVRGQAAAIDGG